MKRRKGFNFSAMGEGARYPKKCSSKVEAGEQSQKVRNTIYCGSVRGVQLIFKKFTEFTELTEKSLDF